MKYPLIACLALMACNSNAPADNNPAQKIIDSVAAAPRWPERWGVVQRDLYFKKAYYVYTDGWVLGSILYSQMSEPATINQLDSVRKSEYNKAALVLDEYYKPTP